MLCSCEYVIPPAFVATVSPKSNTEKPVVAPPTIAMRETELLAAVCSKIACVLPAGVYELAVHVTV